MVNIDHRTVKFSNLNLIQNFVIIDSTEENFSVSCLAIELHAQHVLFSLHCFCFAGMLVTSLFTVTHL